MWRSLADGMIGLTGPADGVLLGRNPLLGRVGCRV